MYIYIHFPYFFMTLCLIKYMARFALVSILIIKMNKKDKI
jgi:hypothetical protein